MILFSVNAKAEQSYSYREQVIVMFSDSPHREVSKREFFCDFAHTAAVLFDLQKLGALSFSGAGVMITPGFDFNEDEVLSKAYKYLLKKGNGKSIDNCIIMLSLNYKLYEITLNEMTKKGYLKKDKETFLIFPVKTIYKAKDTVWVDFSIKSQNELILFEAINSFAELGFNFRTDFDEDQKQLNKDIEASLHRAKASINVR
ncbi:MAG: hypothetical protein LAT68_15395 [Cyclobacteriaceae bacterium]|nr:hypothetical protein [Cyclobacteriaceae bacterium]